MTDTYYVKLAYILENCFEIKADSPDDAIDKVNKSVESFGGRIADWNIVDYNIEVQDDE